MIKRLVKHGRKWALIIDKSLLQAAGLEGDASFQLIVNPNGGLLIQSVDEKFEKPYQELSVELFELMKNLSKK